MIRRIRTRHDFERLRRDGARIRATHLWSVWCPEPTASATSIAYAIGRASGPAVTRNRLRRRLRAIFHDLDRQRALPPGLLLIGPRQTDSLELTYDQLWTSATSIVNQIHTAEMRTGHTPTDGSST